MNEVIRAAAQLQAVCETNRWRSCLIGGLALQRWGEPRETIDVDGMHIVLHGMVRGRTIELDRDPGIEENRVVEVICSTPTSFLRTCGVLPDCNTVHAGLRKSHKGFSVRSCKNRKRGEKDGQAR